MDHNINLDLHAKTNYMDELIKQHAALDIEDTVRLLSDDFPMRTLKDELEREIAQRAKTANKSREEIVKELRKTCGSMNVSNWLSGNKKSITKESAVKIAFALHMNANEASWFLMQSCWLDGFYARDYKDLIYRYCLDAKLEYDQAKALIEEFENPEEKPNPNPNPAYDERIGRNVTAFFDNKIKSIETIDELRCLINNYKAQFGSFRRRAYEMFMALFNEIKAKAKQEPFNDEKRERKKMGEEHNEDPIGFYKDIQTFDEIFNDIALGIPTLKDHKAILKDVLGKIAEDSLSRTTAAEINASGDPKKNKKLDDENKQRKRITEVKRKHLLLLWLYAFGGTPACDKTLPDAEKRAIAEAEFENCIETINDELLEPCGMPLLDPRHPLDWVIMNSLYYAFAAGASEEESNDTISEDEDASDEAVARLRKVMERLFSEESIGESEA